MPRPHPKGFTRLIAQTCKGCGAFKQFTEFYAHKARRFGVYAKCGSHEPLLRYLAA